MFIDESGDLGRQSRYFVFAALTVKDPLLLDRIIKNMRRNKFKKELKDANEIKANSSSPALVKYALSQLNNVTDASVSYIILEKAQCYSPFLLNDKHKLYNFAAGRLAEHTILEDADLVVRIDLSKGKQVLRDDFNNYFKMKLNENSTLREIEIYHSLSHAWNGLQFADLLAWSKFQKVEHNNDEFTEVLKIRTEVRHVWKYKND
jgi:Protein of unknown function (DUF3800)